MQQLVKTLRWLIVIAVLIGITIFTLQNYSIVFAKSIEGQVEAVERVTQPMAVVGSTAAAADVSLYSFAVRIRAKSGRIYTASSEDRQWAIAKAGDCVKAKFYPYPPWDFDKADTFFNARLTQMLDCKTP